MKVTYQLNLDPSELCTRDAILVVETALESARKVLKQMSYKNNLAWTKHIEVTTNPIPDEQ